MADISGYEMGLVIGLVVGVLGLGLIIVLTYILYDRRRTKKKEGLRIAHEPGAHPRLPPSAPSPPGAAIAATAVYYAGTPAAGHNWTTINNSMVGLEMCENTNSQLADGEIANSQQSGNGSAAQLSYSGVNIKTLFSMLLSSFAAMLWGPGARARRQDHRNSAPGRGEVCGGSTPKLASGDAKQWQAGAPAAPLYGKTAAERGMTVVPGTGAQLSVVMVQLNATAGWAAAGPSDSDSELPLGSCLGDATVSMMLEPLGGEAPPEAAAEAAAEAVTTAIDGGGGGGPAGHNTDSAPADATAAPMLTAAPPGGAPAAASPLPQLHTVREDENDGEGGAGDRSPLGAARGNGMLISVGRQSTDNGSCVVELGGCCTPRGGASKGCRTDPPVTLTAVANPSLHCEGQGSQGALVSPPS